MNKILHWLLLLVLIGTMGVTQAQSLNYVCDFEDDADLSEWTMVNGTKNNKWCIGSATNNTESGAKALYISNNDGASHLYALSPATFVVAYHEFTLDATTYDISYDWVCNGEKASWGTNAYDFMRVALIPQSKNITADYKPSGFSSTSLPSGWIELDNGNALVNQTTWQNISFSVDIENAGTYRLAVCWVNDGGTGRQPPAAIDNIVFKAQTCPKPKNIDFSNITSSSVTVNWIETGSATAWDLEYGISGFTLGEGHKVTATTDHPYTITGLNSNTAYDVYVRSNCGDDDISGMITSSFRTACGDMELPFFDDFESYENNSFPFCWFLDGEANVRTNGYSDYSYTGQKCISITENSTLISPKVVIPLNQTLIHFAAKKSANNSGKLQVGFITDLANNDFTLIQEFDPYDFEYHLYQIDLGSLDIASQGYIAIRQNGATSNYSGYYIDEVTIDRIPSCATPINRSITNISSNNATINWSSINSDASIEIKIGTHQLLSNATIDTIVSNTGSAIIQNLQESTSYYVWMRSKCGDTDSSMWQEVGSFKTLPSCAKVEGLSVNSITTNAAVVSWHFNRASNNHTTALLKYKQNPSGEWNEQIVSGNSYILHDLLPAQSYMVSVAVACSNGDTSATQVVSFNTASGVVGEEAGDGSYYQSYFPTDGGSKFSYTQAIYAASTVLGMDTIRGIAFHSRGSSQDRQFTVYLANTSMSTFVSGRDYLPASELTLVYTGTFHATGSGWDTITFDSVFVNNGGNVVVAVYDNSARSSYYSPDYFGHDGSGLYKTGYSSLPDPSSFSQTMTLRNSIADVRFIGEVPPITCAAPAVAMQSATENSISINWVAGLDETSWIVDYRLVGSEEWINHQSTISETSTVISGLQSSTAYEVRVGSLCSNDTLYGYVNCFTECGIKSIPYYENFITGVVNPCWATGSLNPHGTSFPSVNNGKLTLPTYSYVVLPEFNEPINTLQLRFKVNAVDVPIEIGIVSEQDNIMTFESLATLTADPVDVNADIICRFNLYSGEGRYIALRTSSSSINISELHVENLPACAIPSHLHVASLGGSKASFAWDAFEDATQWKINIVPTGESPLDENAVIVNDKTYTTTSLSLNTTYDVYVSSVCGSSTSGAIMITFTTMKSDPISLPIEMDFSNEVSNAYWTMNSFRGTNKFAIGPDANSGTPNALYISNDEGLSNEYAIGVSSFAIATLPIEITDKGLYAFFFDWKCVGESSYDFGRFALVPSSVALDQISTERGTYNNTLPEGWIALDEGNLKDASSWQSEMWVDSLAQGVYNLVILWHNDGSGGKQPPLAIDNLSMRQITCDAPINVTISEITSNSAIISWNNNTIPAEGWQLVINHNEPIIVHDSTYTLNDLDMGMGYDYEVTALCGADDKSLPVRGTFHTLCGNIQSLPVTFDFNTETVDEMGAHPHCWTITTEDYPTVFESSDTYSPALKFYGYYTNYGTSYIKNIASLPMMDESIAINSLEISMNVKADDGAQNVLYVGVCEQPGVASTFTPIDTIDNFSGEWQEVIVSLANYHGNGRYLTLYTDFNKNYYKLVIYVDDLTIQTASPCLRPTNVAIDSYTHKSATFTWHSVNPEATFNIALSTGNDVTKAERIVTEVPNAPFTITNLEGNTTYNAWIAANCSDCDTVSAWVSLGQFTTNPTCAEVRNLHAIDINATRATITWQAPILGEPVTEYIVSYNIKHTTDTIIDTISKNYLFLNNLTPNATYELRVTTVCNEAVSNSNSITFVPKALGGCNIIGDGDQEIDGVPVSCYHHYSMTQMIFSAEELVYMSDEIRGVTFECSNAGYEERSDVSVYMGYVDADEFVDGWIPLTNLTKVFQGEWIITPGECQIVFDSVFYRTNHDKNIILVIDDNSRLYNNYSYFYYTETAKNTTAYRFQDYTDISETSTCTITNKRPNVTFDATCMPQTCYAPSVVVSALSDNQIDIVWSAGGDESQWAVLYRSVRDAEWTVLDSATMLTTASITNLIPGNDYLIRVGSLCSSDTIYRTIEATTECGPMPLPFIEDFESFATGRFYHPCWFVTGNRNPQISEVYGNTQMLKIEDNAYIVFPEFTSNINELQIRLRSKSLRKSTYALVGYITNPNNIATFQALDTIRDLSGEGSFYSTIRYNSLPTATGARIAIFVPHNNGAYYIDDVIIEPVRTCVEPTHIEVSNINTNSVDISWEGDAPRYLIEYGEADYRSYGESGIMKVVSGNSFTLNNLNFGTEYDFYLRSICGEGDVSYETNVNTFSTTCPVVHDLTLSNITDQSVSLSWSDNDASSWEIQLIKNNAPRNYVADDNIYTLEGLLGGTTYKVAIRSTCGLADSPWSDTITFQTLCPKVENVVASDISNTSAQLSWTKDFDQRAYEVNIYNDNFNDTFNVTTNLYNAVDLAEGTTYHVAIRAKSLENIYSDWSEPISFVTSCAVVTDLAVDDITINAAQISWNATEGQSSWEVNIYNNIFNETYTVSETAYAAINLHEGSNYQVQVRAMSDEGIYSPWCEAIRFNTICAPISNVAVSNISLNAAHISWQAPEGQNMWQIKVCHNTDTSLMSVYTTQHDLTGLVEGGRYHVYVRAISSENIASAWSPVQIFNTLYAPVTSLAVNELTPTTATIGWNASEVQSQWQFNIFNTNSNQTFSVSDNPYLATQLDEGISYRVAVRAESLDGILSPWSDTIDFVTPCAMVTNLAVSNINFTTANLTWSATPTQTDWEVMVSGQDFDTTAMVSQSSFALTNLAQGAYFSTKVRAKSAENVYSEWCEIVTFHTNYESVSNVTYSNVTSSEAYITWTAPESQSSWQLRISNEDYNDTIDIQTEAAHQFSNLRGGVTYQVQVRSLSPQGIFSEWTDPVAFTTINTPVWNVSVDSITATSALISWQSIADQSQWQVNLFNEDENNTITVDARQYKALNLAHGTNYRVAVRAMVGSVYSQWSDTIDFVTICPIVADVNVSNVTNNSVDIDWAVSDGQTMWEVRVYNAQYPSDSQAQSTYTNHITFSSLDEGETYGVTVRAMCSRNVFGNWSTSVEFTTLECAPVMNVEAIHIHPTDAVISWIADVDQSQWEIVCGPQGLNLNTANPVVVNKPIYTMENLTPETAYDVYVRAVCSDELSSPWSAVMTFTTVAEGVSIDDVESNVNFSIYPNPTSNTTTISLNGVEGKVEISIVDMNGRMLQTESLECGSNCEKRIDVANLAQGTYFVRVLGDNINSVRKLIVR